MNEKQQRVAHKVRFGPLALSSGGFSCFFLYFVFVFGIEGCWVVGSTGGWSMVVRGFSCPAHFTHANGNGGWGSPPGAENPHNEYSKCNSQMWGVKAWPRGVKWVGIWGLGGTQEEGCICVARGLQPYA